MSRFIRVISTVGFVISFLVLPELASAKVLAVKEFTAVMKSSLPTALCARDHHFRRCFKVTESRCRQVASRATNACINNMIKRMPAKVGPEEGRKWGATIGACTGNAYDKSLRQFKVTGAECAAK